MVRWSWIRRTGSISDLGWRLGFKVSLWILERWSDAVGCGISNHGSYSRYSPQGDQVTPSTFNVWRRSMARSFSRALLVYWWLMSCNKLPEGNELLTNALVEFQSNPWHWNGWCSPFRSPRPDARKEVDGRPSASKALNHPEVPWSCLRKWVEQRLVAKPLLVDDYSSLNGILSMNIWG